MEEEFQTIVELLVGTLLRASCKGWAEMVNSSWDLVCLWSDTSFIRIESGK